MDSNVSLKFCDANFWDLNSVWNTEIPDFTPCFQNIIFVLVPFICFWPVAVINIWRSSKLDIGLPLPWTLLLTTKLVFTVFLEVISITKLAFESYVIYTGEHIAFDELCTTCVKTATFIFIFLMQVQHKKSGVMTSSALSIFWFISSICGAVMYRSSLLGVFYEGFPLKGEGKFILDMCYYPVLFLQFILALFTDTRSDKELEDRLLLEEVPIFSFITFHWFNSIVLTSTRRLLTIDDFPPLIAELRACNTWLKFNAVWSKKTKNVPEQGNESKPGSSSDETQWLTIPRLSTTLIKAFWPWLIIAVVVELIMDVMRFFPSLIMDLLITFASSNEYVWKGYLYCMLLFTASILTKFLYHLLTYYSLSLALQFKSALSSAVYRKALVLSSDTRKQYTLGELVNLMAVDIDNVYSFAQFFSSSFGAPLRVILTIALLWQYLGPSCLAGVAVILLVTPTSSFIYSKQSVVQQEQMETKDLRLKHMNELLNGIKVLKLCAWEIPFMRNIEDIRTKEVKLIKVYQYGYAMFSFIWSCCPFFVAAASFATFVLSSENNILDPSTAFVSLSLLNLLRFSLFEIPEFLSELVQTNISLKRLRLFLTAEERNKSAVGKTPDKGSAISIRDATFSWESEGEAGLKNVNLQIPTGSLVAIVGSVGSGKSSLLSAILGDMPKVSGSVDLAGSTAYVPQQAWILNATVKQNILFVKPFVKKKYQSIVSSCCLEPDLELLPGGDMTEIGEKGVNLSGGQKQRVSLARAAYQNADIYLLDDPLSAVDAHVGKSLFDDVIGRKGMLRKKTRVLVTHNISVLPYVDFIVTVKDGKIEEMGTYEELTLRDGPFANFIKEHQEPLQEGEDGDILSPQITGMDASGFIRTVSTMHRTTSSQSSISTPVRMSSIDSSSRKSVHNLIEEETMEIGTVKRGAYLDYMKHASLKLIFGLIIGNLGYQALEVGGSIWLSEWSTDPVLPDGTQDAGLRNIRIGVYTAIGVGQAIAVLAGCIFLAYGAARASKIFHQIMLESVMKSPMTFFDTTPLGRIINRFGKDIEVVDTSVPMDIDTWLSCLTSILATCVVIGINMPPFLASLIPLGAVYYMIQKLYMITSRQIKRQESISRSPVYSHFSETMQGVSSIRAYSAEEEFVNRFEERIDINIAFYFYGICSNRWLGIRLEILGNIIVLTASVLSVVSRGSLDGALVGLILTYALSITEALLWVIRSGTELENDFVSVERIKEYTTLTPEAPWMIEDSRPPSDWPSSGNVSFQNYSTRYRENLDLVLKRINLDICPEEKVGIVGRTGAGKSSVTLALFRIIEATDGCVVIDDVDVSKIGLHDLRSKLTIIPQDPVLFTGPLRMNLDPNCDYSDDELWASLEHAHLKTFVTSLAEGLNHDILEGGENLSVGQRQLVCLARALLKKTKILVLDEATAAVDMETDRLIQNTIRQEFEHYTVITIAHRINTIMDYDKVIVMDAGEIVEVGKPSDLLHQSDSLFFSLARNARLNK